MSQAKALPKEWKWVKLGEVLKVRSGSGLTSKNMLESGFPVYGGNGISGYYSEFMFENPVLILGRVGAKCGVVHVTKPKSWVTDNALIVDSNPKFIDKKYLFWLLFKMDLNQYSVSTAQPVISGAKIYPLEIPLPPLSIQAQIVEKLETLLSELDKGKAQLLTAQAQLKTYRQAVLKYAFEGKLTNKDVKEGELPKGWTLKKLNDIGKWSGGGTPSKANKSFWENGEILWVSPKDMKSKTILDTIDKVTEDAIKNSSAKLIPKGSILFVMRSGILRRTLPVAITVCDVTVNQDLQALTPKAISTNYIYWYIECKNESIRRECSKDGTTVESIESIALKNYQIPICSDEEQLLIVTEIERRLSVCDHLEGTIKTSLAQSETLRQSLLKQAFEGRLI